MELVEKDIDSAVYHSYKAMTPGKESIGLEELRRNADHSEKMSHYNSVQKELDTQDEMITMVRDKRPNGSQYSTPLTDEEKIRFIPQVNTGRGFGWGGSYTGSKTRKPNRVGN
jgi:hypothetical protein